MHNKFSNTNTIITKLLPQFITWWVVNSWSVDAQFFFFSSFTTSHMTSCDKNCVIVCGPSIILIKIVSLLDPCENNVAFILSLTINHMGIRKFWIFRKYHKFVLPHLTWIVDRTINLINETHNYVKGKITHL